MVRMFLKLITPAGSALSAGACALVAYAEWRKAGLRLVLYTGGFVALDINLLLIIIFKPNVRMLKAKNSQLEHSAKRSLPFTDISGTSQANATSPFTDSNGAAQLDDAVGDSENLGTESSNGIIETTAELKGKDLTADLNLEIIG